MTIKENKQHGFTLAETLIGLAIIGIIAAMVLPGVVKNYQTKSWAIAKDLFEKKLDIAMKVMNTNGTLTGYQTTEAFLKELKKNIKITNICSDSKITNCFPKEVVWTEGEDAVEITSSAVTYSDTDDQDWAETLGVQFVNGVEALIAYNKNCTDDPYNNQFTPISECIGIVYDVSGGKKPNTNGKDIAYNSNVADMGCVYRLSDGTCFTKILAPGTDFSPMTLEECQEAVEEGTLGIRSCYYDNDYWAGAVRACGGMDNMTKATELAQLGEDLYGTKNFTRGSADDGLSMDKDKAAPFLALSKTSNQFQIWGGNEYVASTAYSRTFYEADAYWYNGCTKNNSGNIAVCVKH